MGGTCFNTPVCKRKEQLANVKAQTLTEVCIETRDRLNIERALVGRVS